MIPVLTKYFYKIAQYGYGLTPPLKPNSSDEQTPLGYINKALPYMFYNWGHISFLKRINKENGFEKIQDNSLHDLVDSERSFGLLMSLYNICFYYGRLDLLCSIRKSAHSSITQPHKHRLIPINLKRSYLKIKALSLIELRDFDGVLSLLQQCSFFFNDPALIYSIFFQLPQSYRNKIDLPNLILDEGFRSIVSNKSVAIVGPAFSNIHSGEEIDNFDIVIRLNYNNDNNFGNSQLNGKRIDISYYNVSTSKKLSSKVFNGVLLSYVVPPNSIDLSYVSNRVRERTLSPVFLNGTPNMIQNIVFDILLYSPSHVKIFKCDFYAGESTYDSSYVNDDRNKLTIKNLALHDQWSQVCFIRNLYQSNSIDVDDSCKRIVSMSCQEYFSVLSSKFLQ